MKNYGVGRRDFMKKFLVGVVAVTGLPHKNLFIRRKGYEYDSKG